MYVEIVDSLQYLLNDAELLIYSQKQLLGSMEQENKLYYNLYNNYKELNTEYDKKLKHLNKALNRRKKINYLIGGVSIVTLGVLVGVMVTK